MIAHSAGRYDVAKPVVETKIRFGRSCRRNEKMIRELVLNLLPWLAGYDIGDAECSQNPSERELVMRLSKVLLTCAAASMMATPVVASAATANPAAKLSLSKSVSAPVRASSPAGKSKAAGSGVIILILAGAAVIAGIIAATSGNGDADSN